MRCVGASCGRSAARGGSTGGCVPGSSAVSCSLLASPVGRCSAPRVAPHISSVRRTKSGSSGSVSYLLRFSDIARSFTKHVRAGFAAISILAHAIFYLLPAFFALVDAERAEHRRVRAQPDDEVERGRIERQPH